MNQVTLQSKNYTEDFDLKIYSVCMNLIFSNIIYEYWTYQTQTQTYTQ